MQSQLPPPPQGSNPMRRQGVSHLHFLKDASIRIFVSQGFMERKSEVFHSLVYPLNGCRGQADRGFLSGSHGARGPRTCCLPRHIDKEPDGKWRSWDLNQCPYGMWALQVAH